MCCLRLAGLEPAFVVWKTAILPLNYKRLLKLFGGASFKLKEVLPRFERGLPESESGVFTNWTIRPSADRNPTSSLDYTSISSFRSMDLLVSLRHL